MTSASMTNHNNSHPTTTTCFHAKDTAATTTTTTVAKASPIPPSIAKRLVYGSNDVLFGAIEEQQGNQPFGKLLDAGTGMHSLRWIATLCADDDNNNNHPQQRSNLGLTSYTAITADATMKENVKNEAIELGIDSIGKVIMGNWFDPYHPLTLEKEQETYDTIIADYLIGAMDGFSPYQQDQMIPKLFQYLKPHGRLYIIGLQPLPDKVGDNDVYDNAEHANIICKIRQIRDACILLAGHRCYREYPLEWIQRQLLSINNNNNNNNTASDVQVLDQHKFPILYKHETIVKQINVARSKLQYFPSKALANEMSVVLDNLEQQSLTATQKSPTGRIKLGFDYVISVEKK